MNDMQMFADKFEENSQSLTSIVLMLFKLGKFEIRVGNLSPPLPPRLNRSTVKGSVIATNRALSVRDRGHELMIFSS